MSRAYRGFRIFGTAIKILFFMLIFSVIAFLFWRIFSSGNPKTMEGVTPNDKIVAAYEQEGDKLSMFKQEIDMISRAEHNYGYFAITDLYGLGTRVFSGIVTWQVLVYAAIGWIGSLIGNTLGGLVFNKINAQTLKKIIYVGMIVSGAIMILKELLK